MKSLAILAYFACTFTLVACSGGTATFSVTDDAGPDTGASPAEVDDAGEEAAQPKDGGRKPDGATASHADASDAPVDAGPLAIDPIAVGNSWTYQIQTFGTSLFGCKDGTFTSTVLRSSTLGGREAFEETEICEVNGNQRYAQEGDRVWLWRDSDQTWNLQLDAPVEDGHTWNNPFFAVDVTWKDAGGPVSVPAGTFSDCWTATDAGTSPAYSIFCRGVGPIRMYVKDAFGNGYDAQLVSYKTQ